MAAAVGNRWRRPTGYRAGQQQRARRSGLAAIVATAASSVAMDSLTLDADDPAAMEDARALHTPELRRCLAPPRHRTDLLAPLGSF